jgi:hypothetical protein
MSNETAIEKAAPQAVAAQHGGQPSMLQAVMAAALNPALDPERIKAFLDMAREMDQDEKRQQFNVAFAAAYREISLIKIAKNGQIVYEGRGGKKDSVITFIKHDDISRVIKPILHQNGLTATYSAEIVATPPKTVMVMTIMHVNGYSKEWRSVALPMIDSGGGKSDIQGAGSVSTYGRRYVIIPAFDIVAEDADDDGNLGKAAKAITEQQADTILDILHELDRRQPGSAALFAKWIKHMVCVSKF